LEDASTWTSLTERVGVWRYGILVLLVIIIGIVVVRMAVGPMADRRTRRILEESLKEEDEARRSGSSSPDSQAPPTKSGDGKPR
jgi:hypothetical protein